MRNRKQNVIAAIFMMLLGVFPFLNSLSNPRVANLRGADYLQIIAVGLLLGVGGSRLVAALRFSETQA